MLLKAGERYLATEDRKVKLASVPAAVRAIAWQNGIFAARDGIMYSKLRLNSA